MTAETIKNIKNRDFGKHVGLFDFGQQNSKSLPQLIIAGDGKTVVSLDADGGISYPQGFSSSDSHTRRD